MGSVRTVTNSAAAPQWTNEWEPYGLPRTSTQDDPNAAVNPIGWTGQYADPTGSIHLRARQYDPTLGRFTAPDQAAAMPYSATGTYAAGNPLAFADPTGLWPSLGDVWNAVTTGAAVVAPIAGMAAPFSGPLAPIVGGVAIAAGAITAIDSAYNAYQVCSGNEKGSCAGEIAAGALGIAMGGAGASAMRAGLAARRAANSADDWPVLSGIVRDASKGKGNFGLGSGTASQAERAGKAWVGEGYMMASDGKTLVSASGLRQWRPPSYKPILGKWQSNFESRLVPRGQWQGNGHLDITDLP
jgi:RHS repeat-associated protein